MTIDVQQPGGSGDVTNGGNGAEQGRAVTTEDDGEAAASHRVRDKVAHARLRRDHRPFVDDRRRTTSTALVVGDHVPTIVRSAERIGEARTPERSRCARLVARTPVTVELNADQLNLHGRGVPTSPRSTTPAPNAEPAPAVSSPQRRLREEFGLAVPVSGDEREDDPFGAEVRPTRHAFADRVRSPGDEDRRESRRRACRTRRRDRRAV